MSSDIFDDTPSWYAIHTQPKQEARAELNLRARRVETFSPRVREYRYNQHTGRPTQISMPLFPSYLFAKLIISRSWHDVSFTRGVRSVVCFGGDPVPIEEEVISYIQSRVDEEGFVRLGEELSVGDPVVIKDGPFKTLTGVFKRGIAGKGRVMLLLSSLNYQAHIEVGRNLVKKIV